MFKRIRELERSDKYKLFVLVCLFIITIASGIYVILDKVEGTAVESGEELQSFLDETAWECESDEGRDVLLFSQFMDLNTATLSNDNELIYNWWSYYRVQDKSHIEVYEYANNSKQMGRMNGTVEIVVRDDETILVNERTYHKTDWMNVFAYTYFD